MNILDYTFDKYCDGECELLDAHCHLKRCDDFKIICFGLLPSGYIFDRDAENSKIKVGLGFHPWACNNADNNEILFFEKYAKDSQFIGEIGLDFGKNHIHEKEQQLDVFQNICKILSTLKNKVVSLHSVNSAIQLMDIIEKSSADAGNIMILHWFSGSSQELQRALKSGYYFSVGPKMLATKKGYEYIRQIPEEKMFLETDLPWDSEEVSAEEHYNLLNDFAMQVRELKQTF